MGPSSLPSKDKEVLWQIGEKKLVASFALQDEPSRAELNLTGPS